MAKEIELELEIQAETEMAYMVSGPYSEASVWLPKSQIDWSGDPDVGDTCSFIVPEWLAIEKGLI